MNVRGRNERLIVRDIAHARAGDKGNTSNINIWVYDPEDFELLKRTVTPERVKAEFPKLIRGNVTRYVIEHLHGLNLVMSEALEGGVNASLNLDSHGKSWSYLILGLALDSGDSRPGR
ncbi:MAG TPA: hypothetical protein VEC94_16485 [Pseudolabrys sp.]|nr:hypothetical protein [Pseudolabrys sp.]